MTEQQYIALFEAKAQQHRFIQHVDAEGQKAFFYIENPDELGEFDIALRNIEKDCAMLLVANNGEFNDSGSNNYTEELNGQLYIVIRKKSDSTIREINNAARSILLEVLGRVRLENKYTFRLDKLPFQKVGPMNDVWYGYTVAITFVCPFSFSLNNGNWLDKAL